MDAIQKLKERQERETRRLFEAQQAQLTQLNKLHLLRNNTNNPSPAAATATASIPDLDLPSSSGTGVTAAATSSSPARSTSGRSNREAWPGPAARNTKVATTSSSSAATPSAFSEASAAGTKHSPGRKIGRAKNADDQVVGSASRLSSPTNPSYDDDDEREMYVPSLERVMRLALFGGMHTNWYPFSVFFPFLIILFLFFVEI